MSGSALRLGVASHGPKDGCFRLEGEEAFEVADALVPSDLYLQHGQLKQTLLLDDEGLIVADALVGREDDAYLIVTRGLPLADAERWLTDACVGRRARVHGLHTDHAQRALHGPYAWELLGEWLGPDLVGLPYLGLTRVGRVLVLRESRTGEFGYQVFVPRELQGELAARLHELGPRFDLAEVSDEALSLAALENGFFDVEREGRLTRDPLQLQLKWRLSRDKTYRGSAALTARWSQVRRRTVWLRSESSFAIGDALALDGERVGVVVNAGWSANRWAHVGIALVDRAIAHAGLVGLDVVRGGVVQPVVTVAPPLIDNRSLYVSPQRHSYATRQEQELP